MKTKEAMTIQQVNFWYAENKAGSIQLLQYDDNTWRLELNPEMYGHDQYKCLLDHATFSECIAYLKNNYNIIIDEKRVTK